MLGAGAAFSTVLTAYRFTNGLRGVASKETDEDEVERRENAKKNRRRPISETIQELGEGRGRCPVAQDAEYEADHTRHIRSWLRGEETPKATREVRLRRQSRTGDGVDAEVFSLVFKSIGVSPRTPMVLTGACTYIIQCLTRRPGMQSLANAGFLSDVDTLCSNPKFNLRKAIPTVRGTLRQYCPSQ